VRICLLSSGHPPDDDRIFYKEATSLAKKYDDVWIISPHPDKIPKESNGIKFLSIPYARGWFERLQSVTELVTAGLTLKADVYHCHEPESLLAALKIKKTLQCKVVFDSHEMYSATLAEKFPRWLETPIILLYQYFERKQLSKCDALVGATFAISEYLADALGRERTTTILNCTLPDIFGKASQKIWDGKTIICHEGYLHFSRGIRNIIEAVRW